MAIHLESTTQQLRDNRLMKTDEQIRLFEEALEQIGGEIHGEGCKTMIDSYFSAAKVTNSYDYAGRFTDTKLGRTASLEKRAADFTKYKSLKP